MQISNRIAHLSDDGSDGWDVFYRSRAMIADGVDVTELTIGEHDIRTDASILDAMEASARSGKTGYSMVPGETGLRKAVAARVQDRTGVPTTMDNVLITPGGQSALFAAHSAVLDPGDTGCFLDPHYTTYPGTIRAVGGVARAIATTPDTAFQPTASQLEQCAGARSLLVNSPNNPTGVVYSKATMLAISGAAQRHDLWVISDEVYDTQVWDGTHISPRALPDLAERTLVIGSMSKSHAMTGSRVGWIVGPPDVISLLFGLSNTTTYGVPGYIQEAAEFALGTDLETQIGAPFARRRALARDILAGQNPMRLLPSDGAMYLMLDVRDTGMSGEDFANRLLDVHHIAVMPGESFGAAAAGHIRVAMTVEDAAFARALRKMSDFAREILR